MSRIGAELRNPADSLLMEVAVVMVIQRTRLEKNKKRMNIIVKSKREVCLFQSEEKSVR